MQATWFDLAWAWIGLAGAITILALAFGTKKLMANPSGNRWRDPTWLAWLCSAAYLLHNFEEYGVSLFGEFHAFPGCMLDILGILPPEAFFTALNVAMFWVASPIAAALSERIPLMSVAMSGVLFFNALSHIAPFALGVGYTPGALTAIVVFLPLSGYVFAARFGRGEGRLPWGALAVTVFIGAFCHLFLLASLMSYRNGISTEAVLVALQVLNAALFLLITWLFSKAGFCKPRAAQE
jgi:hypothetical protein